MTIRISIADDHPMVIDGIKKMLHYTPIKFIEGYPNGSLLLKGLQQKVPDILLLDIQMPGKTGQELMPELQEGWPEMKIIALTGFDQSYYVKSMLELGAQGYVLKSADKPTMLTAIKTVYQGTPYIDCALGPVIDSITVRKTPHIRSNLLTKREKQVLELIALGMTNQEMSAQLALSVRTVQNYRLGLHLKLDAKNATLLLKKAQEMKLIS